jgi:glutaredoxin 2
MQLYQYHHCPYCVRVDMVANYKNLQHKKVYLLNDDEQTCFDLLNAKMVPILQFADGSAIGESLDIVAKLDEQGDNNKIITPKVLSDDIDTLFAAVKSSTRILTYPRTIRLGLPEFATQSAKDYFQAKKEKMIDMSFDMAMEISARHLAIVNSVLTKIPALPISQTLSMDDVLVYPNLRNLSMVKGLVFPAAIKHYMEHIAALTMTELYFAKAI